MTSPTEVVKTQIAYAGRPTDARGLLPIDVARNILRGVKRYPGAPVHEGRTPAEVKDIEVAHDLQAALLSLDDPDEVMGHLLRWKFKWPLYHAEAFVDRFGAAMLPWFAGHVTDGVLEVNAWQIAPALAKLGSEDALELLLKVSAIGFGREDCVELTSVSSLPELPKKASLDIRLLQAIALFAAKHPELTSRVLARRKERPQTKEIVEHLVDQPALAAVAAAAGFQAEASSPEAPAEPAPAVPATPGPPMKELWARLAKWAKDHAPSRVFSLRAPATAEAIARAEATMGVTFPADYRESLLAHDGLESTEDDDDKRFPWMPGCDRMAPLHEVVRQYQEERKWDDPEAAQGRTMDKGRILRTVFHPWRIPIAGDRFWDQDNTYLDLTPGKKGTVGQLITLVTECDFVVLGTSLREAMSAYVELLESGRWDGAREILRDHPANVFSALREKLRKKAAPASQSGPAKSPKKKPAAKDGGEKAKKKPVTKKPATKKPTKKR
jgi:cell wall assembly regulator SMI1